MEKRREKRPCPSISIHMARRGFRERVRVPGVLGECTREQSMTKRKSYDFLSNSEN